MADPTGGPGPWLKGAAWAAALIFPLLTGALYLAYESETDRIERRQDALIEAHKDAKRVLERVEGSVDGLVTSTSVSTEKVESLKRRLDFWARRVERNSDRLETLKSRSDARADPFTGKEGLALERRVERIEKCCDRKNHRGRNE